MYIEWKHMILFNCGNQVFSILKLYTGCFTTCGHYCRRRFPRNLWLKSWYKHVSDIGRLRCYGHFSIPVHAHVWTALQNQMEVEVLNLMNYRLRSKLYFCHLSRAPSCKQSRFRFTTIRRYLRNERLDWPVYTIWSNYHYVFKITYHLHYSDCDGNRRSEQYGDSFVKARQ
jgi:hypothetical protein